MGLQLPADFIASYKDFISYPENSLVKSTYSGALRTQRLRLEDGQRKLFAQKDANALVPFRDLDTNGQPFVKHKVHNDDELQDWLGDRSRSHPTKIATKKDPKCRFIFFYSDNSMAQLHTTRRMFVRTLSYHQVMPSYLDFTAVFGIHSHTREPRFSGFREQTLFSGPPKTKVDSLGRSGRQFQLCYNLKAVGTWSDCSSGALVPGSEKWSIRQGAFHHQFDVTNGNSFWIITRAGLDIKERVEGVTGIHGNEEDKSFGTPEQCLKSTFAIHLLLCHWATERWREYFQWLEDKIEEATYLVVYGPQNLGDSKQIYSPAQLKRAQSLEESTNEAVMVLEGNSDILTSLKRFYEGLKTNDRFPLKNSAGEELASFASQIDSFIYDSKLQIARGKLLANIVSARKSIILQHLQSQATEQMQQLTVSMQRDSTTVRIIGLMTFLYLPGTFVSTFFSTDVVKYQDQNGNSAVASASGSYSRLALDRWLEVTLPLTLLTFLGAGLWFWAVDRRNKRQTMLPYTEEK